MTEDELVLLLSREAWEEGSNNNLIKKFREKYRDQSELITKVSQGDSKALSQLRWLCGLKVITKLDTGEPQKGKAGRYSFRMLVIFLLLKLFKSDCNRNCPLVGAGFKSIRIETGPFFKASTAARPINRIIGPPRPKCVKSIFDSLLEVFGVPGLRRPPNSA